MRRTIRLWPFALIYLVLAGPTALSQNSQSYLNDTGNTPYGVNIPVENGFIDLSNGNLHLEFPLATHPQRGALKLNERIVYDSRIWMFSPFGTHGSYHWWPYNIYGAPNLSGGWRFVQGNEIGSISYQETSSNQTVCNSDTGKTDTNQDYGITWIDPSGVVHPFNATLWAEDNQCAPLQGGPEYTQGINGGIAADGSGYVVRDDGTGNPLVTNNNGTQVYPQIIDRYGNYWSSDSNSNLIDDTGRTPVIVTQNGNVTYYDVLAPNGTINNNGMRVRYTVTTSSVPVSTNFGQSDTYEWVSQGYLTPVQSIVLPDGSQYTFSYDSYGELSTITLPTGGSIQYGYSNFLDSSNTENRWLTSRTVGSNPPETFTPNVVTTCANYSTGCVEHVTLHKPTGEETVYELTLNNGAWNTTVNVYPGLASNGGVLASSITTNTYTNPCASAPLCFGANYLSEADTTSILYGPGSPTVSSFTETLYNSTLGKISAVKQWDFGAGSSGTPTRETDYTYTGNDIQAVTVLSKGSQAGQTTYAYTSSATTTSGIAQHGTQNAGGPYLQSVSQWLNTGGQVTTTYAMEDTGMITGVTDPNLNPASSISYQCSHSLPYQVTKPVNTLSLTTTYTYDCNSGAIQNVQDQNSQFTSYNYESTAGRPQSINYPDGGQTSYSYPSATEVDTAILATPSPTISSQSIMDSFGRPYQQIQAGVSTETYYDADGRVNCVTNPHFVSSSSSTDGGTCITVYDGLDRPTVQTQPDGNTLTWSYSRNTTTSTDEAGNSWQRTSDVFGRLTGVVEPSGASTTYTYDALGNLWNVSQHGLTRSFVYDSLSRLTSSTNPETGTIGYSYDNNGNVISKTDARGISTTYSYDSLNRLMSKSYTDGTAQSSYTYDSFTGWGQAHGSSIGRLVRGNTCTSTGCEDDLYGYDAMGRINHIEGATPSETGHAAHWVQMQYDLAGDLTGLLYPSGRVIRQSFDGAGRLSGANYASQSVPYGSLTGGTPVNVPYITNISYQPDSSPQTTQYGNGVIEQRNLNSRRQVQSMSATMQTGQTIFSRGYCYMNCTKGGAANNGNIWQISDGLNSTRTQDFQYDSLNRLTGFWLGGVSTQQYGMDSFGNMSVLQSNGQPFNTFDPTTNRINNLPCSASLTPYDVAGNQTCDTDSNNALRTYSYDAESRIGAITIQGSNQPFESYMYAADGNRIRKTNADGTWTEYVYFNGQPLAEKNPDGTWTDYIYANGQRIAKADTADVRVHLSGTMPNPVASGLWVEGNLPIPASYTIKSGDVLSFRMYQQNANGGISMGFTDGSNTDRYCEADNHGDCIKVESQSGQWVNRIVALDANVSNKTISYILVGNFPGAPSGAFDVMVADMSITSTDGTVTPIVTTQQTGALSTGGDPSVVLGLQTVFERVSNSFDAPGPEQTTVYYSGDHLGSARMLLSAGGWPMSTDFFYPYGQEQNPATDTNHYKFTGLERDTESNLDHAMYRQYSSSMGRWMSPDPYLGSMDFSNPQSFNRYSYVGNSPLGFTDPSGLLSCGNCPPGDSGGLGGIIGGIATLGIGLLIGELENLFSHPSFRGSMKPRPSDPDESQASDGLDWDNALNDHLGLPAGGQLPGGGIAGAIGLSGGCEFGACGSSFAGPGMEDHHIFPQAFQEWFEQHGIDIESYTIALTKAAHRLKPGGLHTKSGGNWNAAWKRWIEEHPNATPQEIINQGKKFLIEFGVGAGDTLPSFFIIVNPCVTNPNMPQCQMGYNLTMPIDLVTPQPVAAEGM